MKKKRLFYIILVFVAILIVGFIISYANRTGEVVEEIKPKKQVKIQTIDLQKEVVSTLTVSGTVVPKQYAVVRSLVPGTLEYVFPVGQEIKKGEALFHISDTNIENSYFNSQQNVSQTNIIAEDRLIQAELALNSSKARYELALKNLETVKKQTDQALVNSKNSAIVTYNTSYNILNQTISFLSFGSITNFDFFYKELSTPQSQLLYNTELQYDVAAESFIALPKQVDESNLILSLNQVHNTLVKTKLLVDSMVVLLQNDIGNQKIEGRSIDSDELVVSSYQTQINAYTNSTLVSINALENTVINNQLSVDQAENQLELAKIELNNFEVALQSSMTSTELEKRIAQSQLDNASYTYNNLTLASPFSGTVLSHYTQPGQQVGPGQEIIELGNLSIVEISVEVDVEFAKGLKQNDPVLIDDCQGIISEIEPTGSIGSGKVGVKVQCENPQQHLTSGDILDVKFNIIYQEPDLIIIPINAATIEPIETYVFVVEDGLAKKKTVSLGRVFGNKVSVLKGLLPGDELILRNGVFISANDQVEIVQ